MRLHARELVSTDTFLALSAEINYQLSAKQLNHRALVALILGGARPPGDVQDLEKAIRVLQIGYEHQRRRLGPAAILHPLRTAALLSRSAPEPSLLEVLGAMLHDKEEDLLERSIGRERSARLAEEYTSLLHSLDPEQRWFLGERLSILTRRDPEPYNAYFARILDHAPKMPDLLRVKLADRLDNTLDTSVARPGVMKYNFFRTVFDVLFAPAFEGVAIEEYHSLPSPDEGAGILSNLFKNAIVLSLLRQSGFPGGDVTVERLSQALAVASIRVSQWVALEVFATWVTDVASQRALLHQAMSYCMQGGVEAVTSPARGDPLDGLFSGLWGSLDSAGRHARLAATFEDRPLLAKLAVMFISMFSCFLNDPAFHVRGIDRAGVRPVP